MTIVAVNPHVSVDIFQISSRTRSKRLPLYWEQRLISALRRSGALTEAITSVGYVVNKRGFSVKTQDKTYFVRILFPTNLPIPYIIRRALGQPDCCARAHTLNQNLAKRSTDRTSEHAIRFGSYYSMNLIPCQTCFDKYAPLEYLSHEVQPNRPVDFNDADPKDYVQYTNFVLIWLASSDNIEQLIDFNDVELFENYRIAHIKSINKYFKSIAKYCRAVIDSVPIDQDVPTRCAVTELQVIMNNCLDICGDINNRPLGSVSIDECYGYSEYMSRYRQNAQNIAFALRYSGVECQVLHDEEEMII